MMQQSVLSPDNNVDQPPRAQIYEVQDGERNSNAMYQGGDRSLGRTPGQLNIAEQRLKNINRHINDNRAFNQQQEAAREREARQQEQDALSYDDEEDDHDHDDGHGHDGGDQDDSADMDMAITERNQQSQRNKDRVGDYARDQDASQAQVRGKKRDQIEKSG